MATGYSTEKVSFSFIINAPNAIRNDFARVPISAENPEEYKADFF